MPGGTLGIGEDCKDALASLRRKESSDASVPTPRKPRPWERETAKAREACAIRRIGAHVMSGIVVHG